MSERRLPCPKCGVLVIEGARKCRGCRAWIARQHGVGRSLSMIAGAALALGVGMVARSESPVGEAPPLTPLGPAPQASEPSPLEMAPDQTPEQVAERTLPADDEDEGVAWRTRRLNVDMHPLDATFSASGTSLYVTADDASLREYDVRSGRLLHMVHLPVRGDRLRLLHDRWIAVMQQEGAAHIGLVDTKAWEREPELLNVGLGPADIVALPKTNTAVTACARGKRLSWFDLDSATLKANITLPHATTRLYVLESSEGTPFVGAMGMLYRADRPAGAWIDIFDPTETPFGATRRSIATGREPLPGMVTADGRMLFFADRAQNSVSLLRVDEITKLAHAGVGLGPVAALLMHDDHYGITLDAGGNTITVVELSTMQRLNTLMLPGTPRDGAVTPNGRIAFVSVGGAMAPAPGVGVVVIAGDPPTVVAELPTGRGATRVSAAPAGKRAVVTSYIDRAVTIVEPQPTPPAR
jgi:hypothetical protein